MEQQQTVEQKLNGEITLLRQRIKNIDVTHTRQKIAALDALKKRFGAEVVQVVQQANGQATCKIYQKIYQRFEGRSIEDLIRMLWEPLRQQGFEFTIERSSKGVQINCTACPLAQLYHDLGSSEWGYELYCAADEYLVKDFNPGMGFRRTKTLMEGHDCCDHFYYMKD